VAPRTIATSPIGALFIVVAVWGKVPTIHIVEWLVMFVLGFGLHMVLALVNLRRVNRSTGVVPYASTVASRILAGLVWGLAAPILTHDGSDVESRLIVMMILAVVGVSGGIVIGSGTAAVAQFIVALCLPLLVMYSVDGGELTWLVVPGSVVVVGITVFYGWLWNKSVYGATEARLQADLLAERLEEQYRISEDAVRRFRDLNVAITDMARRDELTGLLNRRGLFEVLRKVDETSSVWFVALLDLDHFKHVNDNHGHAEGDRVLRHLGVIVSEAIPEGAVFGRLGGEEFALVLPGGDLAAAIEVCESVRSAVRERPLVGLPTITISVGIADNLGIVEDTSIIDAALSRADAALYLAKSGGRDRVRVDASTTLRASQA
jgi:diguanylate cyclase (GGDEF)-like protein